MKGEASGFIRECKNAYQQKCYLRPATNPKKMSSLIVYKVHEQEIAQNYGVGTSDKGLRINAFLR